MIPRWYYLERLGFRVARWRADDEEMHWSFHLPCSRLV